MQSMNVRYLYALLSKILSRLGLTKIIRICFRINFNPPNITYEGIYKDFDHVLSKYSNNVGYVSEDYLISEGNKVAEIMRQPPEQYAGNERDHHLLLLLTSIQKRKIRILDVGSGFGLTFLFLNNKIGSKLDYTGIDLPEISEVSLRYFGGNSNFHLSCLSELDEKEFDLVYFGSSLQYFEDYQKTISQTLANSPQMVLIADTPVGELETFVTCQVNMKNRKIPRWIFALSEIDEIFNSAKYELINLTSVEWHSDIHNFSNFPKEYHHISHKNLLYRKMMKTNKNEPTLSI